MIFPDIRSALGVAVLVVLGAGGEPPSAAQAHASAHPPPRRDALARRLCDALHALPAERKRECCGRPLSSLADVCADELSASLRRGAIAIDGATVDQCAAETARQLAGCEWVTPLMPGLPEACRGPLRGRLPAGDRCRSSLECPDGLYCRGLGTGKDGVCTAPGAARARCEVPADNLAAFTRTRDDSRHPVCDGLCVKGQCVPYAPPDGACRSSAQCTPGLQCLGGRCQKRALPKRGESCAAGDACDEGAHCQAGRCLPSKGAGERCRTPFECRALECAKAPGAEIGTCGDPCGPAGGREMSPAP